MQRAGVETLLTKPDGVDYDELAGNNAILIGAAAKDIAKVVLMASEAFSV